MCILATCSMLTRPMWVVAAILDSCHIGLESDLLIGIAAGA